MKNEIAQLLQNVKITTNAYEKVKIATGENFNIFKILGMESAEVKTHSKFLAELLNPKGSHLQGSLFLELFLKVIDKKNANNEIGIKDAFADFEFEAKNGIVDVEKFIGNITEGTEEYNFQDAEGGRIDLLISNKKKAIIIENKIYAAEQEKQLIRYSNYGNSYFKDNFRIIYLTLFGDQPTSSKKDDEKIVLCLSYEKDIIGWLELCKKEAVNLPILRESFAQYINLLKKLTNQTENQKLAMEIQDIILSDIKSSKKISENYQSAVLLIASKIRNKIIEELTSKFKDGLINYEISDKSAIGLSDFGSIWLKPKGNLILAQIGIEGFNPFKYIHMGNSLFIGLLCTTEEYKKLSHKIMFEGQKSNQFWQEMISFSNFENFNLSFADEDFLQKLHSDDGFTETLVDNIVKEILEYFNQTKSIFDHENLP